MKHTHIYILHPLMFSISYQLASPHSLILMSEQPQEDTHHHHNNECEANECNKTECDKSPCEELLAQEVVSNTEADANFEAVKESHTVQLASDHPRPHAMNHDPLHNPVKAKEEVFKPKRGSTRKKTAATSLIREEEEQRKAAEERLKEELAEVGVIDITEAHKERKRKLEEAAIEARENNLEAIIAAHEGVKHNTEETSANEAQNPPNVTHDDKCDKNGHTSKKAKMEGNDEKEETERNVAV